MAQKDAGTLFRSTDTFCISGAPIDRRYFFFFFFSGIRAGIVLLVEKYHFIRAPCAAINHVYEAYRNFMKSGIESV